MPSIVTDRFITCHDRMKEEGRIRSSRQFALELDYRPQNLNEILRGNRDAPLELIRLAVERFRINPLYLYAGEGLMFLDEHENSSLRLLTVVTDRSDQERILHVPIPAQAGYSQEQVDPIFYQDLPAYNLPDLKYQSGTFRSFDVAGDSMEPTLHEGDKVICRYVDPGDWLTGVRDNNVYVIVTRSHLMVKRVQNNLFKHRHLELISDNASYKSVRVNVNDIKELWHLHAKISHFSHAMPVNAEQNESFDDLKQTVSAQSQMIEKLSNDLNLLLSIRSS